MKLVDKLMVYKGQYGYSTLVKNKLTEDKLYVQVGFKLNQEPKKEKVMIEIHDGFLTCYKDKNGLGKPKIFVLKYKELEQNESPESMQQNDYFPPVEDNYFPPVEDDSELPF